MQKKCLLFVMAFSCAAQAIIIDNEPKVQEDRFTQLREDLRNDSDNLIYIKAMVDGFEAIDKAKQEKIKLIEKDRAERKNKVSSNRPWFFGSEAVGTLVYNADKVIDEELDAYKKVHENLAEAYKGYTNFMHNDLSNNAQQELVGAVSAFKTMERALRVCPLDDQACYKRCGAPLYSEMVDSNYRRNIREDHYNKALNIAHDNKIPVIVGELKIIMQKNEAYKKTQQEIEMLDKSIDDLVNPEKIKEREEKKKAQDLEEEKKKKEKEEMEALKNQLQQGNVPNDSNQGDNK